jgi:peptide/nickel transport system substrate-binding protein
MAVIAHYPLVKTRFAAVMAGVALLASGCTGTSGKPSEGLPAGAGGTLTALVTQEHGSATAVGALDPQVTTDTGTLELARCCLFRGLLSYNGKLAGDGGATPQPDLAATLPTVSPDGLTWSFELRPGIHYAPPLQDTEVVAGDFVRSIERALAPASPATAKARGCSVGHSCQIGGYFPAQLIPFIDGANAYASGDATTISGLETPSSTTLQVRLTKPSGDLAFLMALPAFAPIPAKPGDPSAAFGIAQGHDLDFGQGFAVGTGPYMVAGAGDIDFSLPPEQQQPPSGVSKRTLTLVRNPSWDPATDDLRVGYPDQIVVQGVSDTNQDGEAVSEAEQMIEAERGDLLFDWLASNEIVHTFEASPDLRDNVFVGQQDALTEMSLNLAVPPFDDVHVRRAVNLAIDKRALQPLLFTSSQSATHIGPDGMENDLLLNYAPLGDGSGDLSAAKDEMALSEYDRNHDGVCDATACGSVELATPSQDFTGRVEMGPKIRDDLAPLGIHVDVQANDDEWMSAGTDPAAGVAMSLWVFVKDYPDATTFFSQFGSTELHSGGGIDPTLLGASPSQLQHWGYRVRKVPNVDDRIAECTRQVFAEQVTCWKDFDTYLMQEVVPWVPLLAWKGAAVFSAHVTAFSIDQSTPFPSAAFDRLRLAPEPTPSPS